MLMIRDINLDLLRVFYEVAREKNITKAAEKLYISQPAITQSLHKLETGFNAQLFFRTPKGVTLTPVGQSLFEQVNQMMGHLTRMDQILQAEDNFEQGTLTIGCSSNLANEVLVDFVASFLNKYPTVQITILDLNSEERMKKLQSGEIDLCFLQEEELPSSQFQFTPVLKSNYVLFGTQKYEKIRTYQQLNDQPFVVQTKKSNMRQQLDTLLAKNAVTPHFQVEVSGYNLVKSLCKLGVGIGFLPKFVVKNELKRGELIELVAPNDVPILFGYMVNQENESKLLKEFLKFMQKGA